VETTLLSEILFIVTVTLTFDPKIYSVLPIPQGNHVAKFGKDPIYRTKAIRRKTVWTSDRPPPATRHIQSHNTACLETGVCKLRIILDPVLILEGSRLLHYAISIMIHLLVHTVSCHLENFEPISNHLKP
jgi:hypothetical protein